MRPYLVLILSPAKTYNIFICKLHHCIFYYTSSTRCQQSPLSKLAFAANLPEKMQSAKYPMKEKTVVSFVYFSSDINEYALVLFGNKHEDLKRMVCLYFFNKWKQNKHTNIYFQWWKKKIIHVSICHKQNKNIFAETISTKCIETLYISQSLSIMLFCLLYYTCRLIYVFWITIQIMNIAILVTKRQSYGIHRNHLTPVWTSSCKIHYNSQWKT